MYGWPKSCSIFRSLTPRIVPRIAGNLVPRVTQLLQVVPEQFDGHLCAHPRNQFVHPLLNRLADQKVGAWHQCQPLADLLFQLRHGGGRRPGLNRMQHRNGIAFVRFLRVVRQFRTPDFRHHHLHFRKLHHRFLHLAFDLDRLIQRNARQADREGSHRAFIQNRDKLRPQKWKERNTSCQHESGGCQHHRPMS